ncbi:MAG: exosortase/archaeosortase family protein, partial [Verrucomicrobia bacterium]|nr:exosortase/archaeosortase family protein [Verrucomicrobiota bacterium]
VWLVSAPMVSVVEQGLNLFLLGKVVAVVAFVFDVLGLPIEQRGNVLTLPTGNVGVEDACSGIRSLTACLFAGSFLGAVFLEKLWKKIALVAAAMALAFVTNLGRSLFLTAWAYRHGPAAIEGTVHDVAGYAVLGLTVAGLLCLLPLLNLRFMAGAAPDRKPPAPSGT